MRAHTRSSPCAAHACLPLPSHTKCVYVVFVQSASTALEDALRRDFTINALFYNIHTHQVEDYVNVHTKIHNTSPHSFHSQRCLPLLPTLLPLIPRALPV